MKGTGGTKNVSIDVEEDQPSNLNDTATCFDDGEERLHDGKETAVSTAVDINVCNYLHFIFKEVNKTNIYYILRLTDDCKKTNVE